MEIPKKIEDLIGFTRDLVEECMVSRERRRMEARIWRNLFYTGSTGAAPSKYNRCFSHVDKLSSFIFSPADVKFTIEFEGGGSTDWDERTRAASRYFNRKFNKAHAGLAFAQGNEIALVEGCAIAKMNWSKKGCLEPWIIKPAFFGVLREDIADLNRQEAFVHSYYVTPSQFKRMIWNHKDKALLMKATQGSFSERATEELEDSYFHEIVSGAMQPIGAAGTMNANPAASYGAVALQAAPSPVLAPEVAARLIRIDDLWVWNDDQEDWTTIRYTEPGLIIEGRYRHQNLCDGPKGTHPFTRICSNEVPNYFWGRSELAVVLEAQLLLNRRMDDIDRIFGQRARPPRAFSGFQSLTEEKARTLLTAGGVIVEQAIGAKVDTLAPELPPESLAYLEKLEEIFDDTGGFTNILSGEGEPGVRAGVHAGTLLRTSTARLRDRSLLVEHQCAAFGQIGLQILQEKDATVISTSGGDQQLMLKQLPKDAQVSVDSHTSSPAFSEDNRQTAFALAKAEAIDGETLIEMLHPPREDVLVDRLRARQAAEMKFRMENPHLAAEQDKKK